MDRPALALLISLGATALIVLLAAALALSLA